MSKLKPYIPIFCVFFVVIVIDQWTKIAARSHLPGRAAISYLGNSLVILYSENRGAFLNLGANLPEPARQMIFTFAVGIFLCFVTYYLFFKVEGKLQRIAIALIVAGGYGNLIDRIYFGFVTDFLFMQLGPLHTGIFNVADMAISGGLALYLLENFLSARSTKKELNPE
jgi:signal peptidase II